MTTVLSTRDRLHAAAAAMFAENGFHGTSMEDLGSACGISGPAVYKHFAGKDDVLERLLVDVSRRLLTGGLAVVEASSSSGAALRDLVEFHAAFAVDEPDLIRVQDRDLANLSVPASRRVRSLQRSYVEVWTVELRRLDPSLTTAAARTTAHAVFGLLNSTPYAGTTPAARRRLVVMALRALDVGP